MAFQAFDERNLHIELTRHLPASGTNYNTVATGVGIGTRIDALTLVNTEALAHVLNIAIVRAGTVIPVGSLTLPASQGTAGTPGMEVLATLNLANYPAFLLLSGDLLRIQAVVAVGAGFEIDVLASGGDF